MPLRKKDSEALLVFVFSVGCCVSVQSSQGILRHEPRDPQVVELHADGFFEGSSIDKTGAKSAHAVQWSSVPQCARDLFGQHAPEPPNSRGMRELLPGIDAFYIIHDVAHDKRKTRLQNVMKSSRLGDIATWVTWFSEEHIGNVPHQQLSCVFNQSYAEPLFSQSISAPLSRNLKHLWVYHEMVRRGLKSVLVMEDDVVFREKTEELLDNMRELTKTLPEDYGVVMLGDDDLSQGHRWRAQEIEQSFISKHAAQKVSEHLYRGGLGHRGASGYLIDGESASKLLRYVHQESKADAEADALMENALGVDAFFWYEPPLWIQSQSVVTVESVTALVEEHHAPQQESHDDAQWALYHRYLGTPGNDDPYRGARERHHSSE